MLDIGTNYLDVYWCDSAECSAVLAYSHVPDCSLDCWRVVQYIASREK